MGIKLDWQVESEQSTLRATEDPENRRQRQIARRRFLLLVIGLAVMVGLLAALVMWRLRSVENRLRADLLDTVQAEVTALRIGDFANFMAIQRSASDAFLLDQSHKFQDYQQMKQIHRVELSGKVLDVAIDDQRARVMLEEVIDGVPYKVLWYYWHYEDVAQNSQSGWRHVPDDLTFWGDPHDLTSGPVTIHYCDLDAELAQTLAPRLADWWTRGCALLACPGALPALKVEIVSERPAKVEWDGGTLRISSPLVGRTRADVPLSPELEQAISDQVAVQVVRTAANGLQPTPASDAAWMVEELARWLSARLLSGGTTPDPGMIGSLITYYGDSAPQVMVKALHPDSTLDNALSAVTGVPLALLTPEQLNAIQWRDFFQWRLALELRLLAQPDGASGFLSLYDLDDPNAANAAALRQESPQYAARSAPLVNSVAISRDAASQTYAQAETTSVDGGQTLAESVRWRLANGTWKRAS